MEVQLKARLFDKCCIPLQSYTNLQQCILEKEKVTVPLTLKQTSHIMVKKVASIIIRMTMHIKHPICIHVNSDSYLMFAIFID